jgi:hypothetical protein
MESSVIVTVVLAAMSALFWVAYKHPEGYRRIMRWGVPFLGLVIFCGLLSQVVGLFQAGSGAYEAFVESPKNSLGSESFWITRLHECNGRILWIAGIGFPLTAVTVFLWFLHPILGKSIENNDSEDAPAETDDTRNKIRELEEENRNLRELRNLEYNDGCFWEKKENGWDGPFCPACKGGNGKKIHMDFSSIPTTEGRLQDPQCPFCNTWGQVPNPKPPA